jgi:hypothetical protein
LPLTFGSREMGETWLCANHVLIAGPVAGIG